MSEADKHGLSGARAEHSLMDQGSLNAVKRQNGNPEVGSGFPCACHWATRGVRHRWAGDRRAISVTSSVVSRRADCAISFSAGDFKNSLPRLDPAFQICERK